MRRDFETRVDSVLESGHWKKWDGKEPMHFIIDPKSWPKYTEMNIHTGRSKSRRKTGRIAGKL